MLFRQKTRLLATAVALLALGCTCVSAQDDSNHRGRKYKAPPPTSRIEVTVVRADDAKPIENASVIFQLIGEKGNMELKTNEDGKSIIDVLPIGSTMRLQILAKGYQTYGQDYKVDKANMAFDVKLKRPVPQYSIYQHHDQAGNAQNGNKDKDSGSQKDSDKSKPNDSSSQPANPPSQPQ